MLQGDGHRSISVKKGGFLLATVATLVDNAYLMNNASKPYVFFLLLMCTTQHIMQVKVVHACCSHHLCAKLDAQLARLNFELM